MTEALNRAPTGDSARGPGVDETPGPHPLTRRRPESSTSAHATSQASWFRFPRFSKSADTLVDKAVGGALGGGPVIRHVGDPALPLAELLAQILLVDEGPAGEEIPLEVLHARFDLALGLRPVGPTEVGLEATIVGELLEGRIPDDPPLAGGMADRPRPIVEMLARMTAEILESPFMGVEELTERLPEARLVKAAPRVAERQDEHVQEDRLGPEVDPGLAPVDLALLPRRGLKADRRPLHRLLHRAQRPHEAFHRLVAAAVAARPAQLLEQDARGVLDLGRPRLQVARVLGEQRIGALGAGVGLPRPGLQNAPHRLSIQRPLSGDLRLRSPLDVEQPVHFPPAVLADHAPLPEWCDLGASVAVRRRQSA